MFNPVQFYEFGSSKNNLIKYGQEFSNSYWNTTYPTANEPIMTDNYVTAPDGTLTACYFRDAGLINPSMALIYDNSVSIINGQSYVFSIYAKASGTPSVLQISGRAATFGENNYSNFDLTNGTNVYYDCISKIIDVGNGWYRLVFRIEAASNGIGAFVLAIVNSISSNRQVTSSSNEACYIWGAKLEKGYFATGYVNKITGIKYSGAENVDMSEAIVIDNNMITTSESFTDSYWTKSGSGYSVLAIENTINDIYGNLTADTLKETTSTVANGFLETSTPIISGNSYVFSIYAKANTANTIQIAGRSGGFGTLRYANFNLATGVVGTKGSGCTSGIVDVGGGWYRCWMQCTATATVTGGYSVCLTNNNANAARFPSYLGTSKELYIWGAKLEIGTSITNYVPKPIEAPPLVSFGFGSDLHYGTIANYAGRYPQDGDDKLAVAVSTWNASALDFAFMNGDYIDSGHIAYTAEIDHDTTIANLDYIETVFDDFSGNRYYSFGNHDTDKISKSEFIAHTAMNSKYYYFDVNGIRFIVLDATFLSDSDSNDFDSGNQDPDNHLTDWIPPTERTWLDSSLNSAPGKVIVFCHQSLHSDSDPLSVNNASVVRGIIQTYGNVLAVFTGHEHINLKTTISGIPYYSMDAMTKGTYPANAYAIIKVYANNTVKIIGYGSQTSYN